MVSGPKGAFSPYFMAGILGALTLAAQPANRNKPAMIVQRAIVLPMSVPVIVMYLPMVEAAVGVEPTNRGFADLRLGHLATPPLLLRLED
jgi:ABC-type spermidine/putrescine transport system permease subunit II